MLEGPWNEHRSIVNQHLLAAEMQYLKKNKNKSSNDINTSVFYNNK